MAFDLSTAKPAMTGGGFDLSSAKPAAPEPAAPGAGFLTEAQEPLAAMLTGAIAKPVSDVAGLATLPAAMAGLTQRDPQGVKEQVQRALTYEPRTPGGQALTEYNPIALLGKALGWGAQKAGQLVAPPETSGPTRAAVGGGVEEAITQIPTFLGLKAPPVAAAAAGGMKNLARDTMQSALKPTLSKLQSGKAAAGIDTLLEEGVNVTRGGAEKLNTRIERLNEQIADAIKNSPATVDKPAVASRLTDALDRFRKQVTPLSDVKAIQKAWDEFMSHPDLPKITPGTPARTVPSPILNEQGQPFTTTIPAVPPSGSNAIPVKQAQELKQGTYRALGDKSYGELGGADIEAQKTLARGLKEEIADAVPAVRQLNAEESKLLNALSLVERRVLMEANKNPAGLGWLTTNPATFAAYMADRSGLFKSLVARMLNTGSRALPPAGRAGPALGFAVTSEANQLQPPPE